MPLPAGGIFSITRLDEGAIDAMVLSLSTVELPSLSEEIDVNRLKGPAFCANPAFITRCRYEGEISAEGSSLSARIVAQREFAKLEKALG